MLLNRELKNLSNKLDKSKSLCIRFLTFVFEFLISLICNIIRFPGGFCVWHPNMAETGASCRLIISQFFVYVRKQFLFNSSYTIYELIFDVLSKA